MAGRTSSDSWKYLYERLGEKRFQQLCGALLKLQFPDVTCFPVGQKDGGRDATRSSPDMFVVYQVKWTNDRVRHPVAWLDKAVTGEADNLRRLVAEGAEEYLLMTNVAGTSTPGRGTMDLLEQRLAVHSKAFGIPMRCEWQADIDARVDGAPRDLKFAYGDMLAGFDLVRYLIEADRLETREEELRSLLVKVIAAQWKRDAKVKFKQVELDTHNLTDLFIDVEARMLSAAQPLDTIPLMPRPRQLSLNDTEGKNIGGAAQFLLGQPATLTLIRGEPGQGKSTLGQFLCQLHRAAYLGHTPFAGDLDQFTVTDTRLPIRVDLKDYADWLAGGHPLSTSDSPPELRPVKPVHTSLEAFLAYLLGTHNGGSTATVETVNEILARFPMLLVLDGLDEVAQTAVRRQTVDEIDAFATRLATHRSRPQLIVTTRPNASGLPEPSTDYFQILALVSLNSTLRTSYLRKWADARSIRGADRRALQHTFDHRSAEPHIAQLAENPMHLTILLYLMHKRGESVPSQRTDLYRSYMETFLDRETEKNASVQLHRNDLEEVTAFLGWHLHATAESNNTAARLTIKEIKKAINGHLYDIGRDTSLVDELFNGVTDRVWALASKVDGTYEFDVQPVQEYFAAKYLYEVAGVPGGITAMLGHLIRRPFWSNTARFYAGFATINELPALLDGLQEQVERGDRPAETLETIWALLADGVFTRRPRTQRKTAALLRDDLSIQLMSSFVGSPHAVLPADRGGHDLVDMLREDVAANPDGPLSQARMRLAHWLEPDRNSFHTWWLPHIDAAVGTATETAWLQAGIPWQAGRRLTVNQSQRLQLAEVHAPAIALASGVTAAKGSPLEHRLVTAVLDGVCSDHAASPASGYASDLVKAFDPQYFLSMAQGAHPDVRYKGPGAPVRATPHQRESALRRLIAREPRFVEARAASHFRKGQKGTTSPWGNTARALAEIVGPCWLAAEIAVIGAASPSALFTTGGDLTDGSQAFGPNPDYGRLLQTLRAEHSHILWWRESLLAHDDVLSRGVWALALLTVADGDVIKGLLVEFDTVVQSLSPMLIRALTLSSSRIATAGIRRRLTTEILAETTRHSALTSLLIAHHEDTSHSIRPPCEPLTIQRLKEMAAYGNAAWPVQRALTARMLHTPNAEHLDALSALGPTDLISGEIRRAPEAQATLAGGTRLPTEITEALLQNPHRYPASWVAAADRQISTNDQVQHLDHLARQDEWFNF
jgi:hypothetical protein